MPCWLVQTVSLDLENLNKDYLEVAIKGLNWKMMGNRIQTDKGYMNLSGTKISSTYLDEQTLRTLGKTLKKQISIEIIKKAAAKNKWGVVQSAPNKIVLRRS